MYEMISYVFSGLSTVPPSLSYPWKFSDFPFTNHVNLPLELHYVPLPRLAEILPEKVRMSEITLKITTITVKLGLLRLVKIICSSEMDEEWKLIVQHHVYLILISRNKEVYLDRRGVHFFMGRPLNSSLCLPQQKINWTNPRDNINLSLVYDTEQHRLNPQLRCLSVGYFL